MASATESKGKHPDGMIRNILLLSCGWCFGVAAPFVQISTSAVVAQELVGTEYATVPLGVIMVVSAFSAGTVPMLSERYGTQRVYLSGALLGLFGATLCFSAVQWLEGSTAFALFVAGSFPQGITYACINGFRFTAVQLSTTDFAPKAISLVIAGGIFASVAGPLVALWSRTALEVNFAGAYLHVMVLYVFLFISIYFIDFSKAPSKQHNTDPEKATPVEKRPLFAIVGRRKVLAVIALQAISYSGMAALMSALPPAMILDGFSFNQSTFAIVAHMLGMFVPSLFSGDLVAKFGKYRFMVFGFLILLLGSLLFLVNRSLEIYIIGILIVGIGWNFSFVPASAIFATFFTPAEKSYVVSFNEFIVIGILGIVIASSATILNALGWVNFTVVFSVYVGIGLVLSSIECMLND